MTGMSLEPVRRQRLHETVAEQLEDMILTGHFGPGELLPSENEMATQLAVSRTVVRDAIRVLATKGLAEIRHGVGTFVTRSGRERLAEALELSLRRKDYSPWELYVVRRGLELIVVEEAMEKATPEHIAQMREALDRYRSCLTCTPPDVEKGNEEHIRFHQLMAHCTGNRILIDLLDPITVFRIPYGMGMSGIPAPDKDLYIRRHEAIVDAIERKDLQAARRCMLDHLRDLEDRARRATAELQAIQG